tara:strand:+ start:1960 stop:2193 length:234 start_codon:yes stop_codon:yes gene_type:complete
MQKKEEEAAERLRIAANEKGTGALEVSEILDAVIGDDHDKELRNLVTSALKTPGREFTLDEIAIGIIHVFEWRKENV